MKELERREEQSRSSQFAEREDSPATIGVGYNTPIQTNLDGVIRIGYVDAEFDGPGPIEADADGFSIEGLLRWQATEEVELNGGIKHVELDDDFDDTAVRLGGLYSFTPNLAANIDLSLSDDLTSVFVGARYYFDLGL